MDKAKEILRLALRMGLSQREVARGTGCSLGMVNTVLARVKEAGLTDPLSLDTKELGSIIYPPDKGGGTAKPEPDFGYIDREIRKKGVTLFLLWEEYKVQHPDGYMYTRFCTKYREYRKKNSVYMRKVYKAGERMLVDWAGQTMKYTQAGGKEQTAYVFVAVLPCSSLVYTQVFGDMKIESWVEGHTEAFEYFGGVPRLLVPDNAKTAVTKAGRYEVELNRTYQEMAGYYGTAIVPARPRSPRDKAPVETGVQIVERRIIVKLRHSQFFSLPEVREAVAAEREILNDQDFQKLPGSRRSVFLETERHELMKLPVHRYELAQFKRVKVAFDYHVALDKAHYYSVPYQFAGKEVLIRSTSRTVEVLYEGERIACHVRSGDSRRFTTDPAHMPHNHRMISQWSPQRFLSWAAKSGEQTRRYIAALLERTEHPEQAYRTCAGILRLASSVSAERMEQAAGEALAGNIYSYAWFQKLLAAAETREPVIHENLRGKAYYEGEGHVE